jgi:hypothetical protein
MPVANRNCRIWLADTIHVHERGFPSLFTVLKEDKIPLTPIPGPDPLRKAHGAYESFSELRPYLRFLERVPTDELPSLTYCYHETPLPLFPLVRGELLSLLLATEEDWIKAPVPSDHAYLAARMAAENRPRLAHAYAAAMFWIDHYATVLPTLPLATHCLIFSGSLIYQRILLEVLKLSRVETICLEHFLTGSDFYFEERTTPIANASDFRLPTVRAAAQLPQDPETFAAERVKAINKVLCMNNKNVKQPNDVPHLDLDSARPTFLVLGQVQNDFSILETKLENINAVNFWQNALIALMERTNANVVFKTHSWERHKAHLRTAFTLERLSTWRSTLSPTVAARIAFVEDANIWRLAERASHVLALNSQGALELALRTGHKPVVFGRPFYGRAGFTHDYTSVEAFISDFQQGSVAGTLTLNEYEELELWLTKLLQVHLACAFRSGHGRIRQVLAVPRLVKLQTVPPVQAVASVAKPAGNAAPAASAPRVAAGAGRAAADAAAVREPAPAKTDRIRLSDRSTTAFVPAPAGAGMIRRLLAAVRA